MTVIEHEDTTRNEKLGFCYSRVHDVLQYSKNLFNTVDTLARDNDNKAFAYFEGEMEKIDSGDTSNEAAVKFDEYLGTLGTEDEIEKTKKRRKIHGIC